MSAEMWILVAENARKVAINAPSHGTKVTTIIAGLALVVSLISLGFSIYSFYRSQKDKHEEKETSQASKISGWTTANREEKVVTGLAHRLTLLNKSEASVYNVYITYSYKITTLNSATNPVMNTIIFHKNVLAPGQYVRNLPVKEEIAVIQYHNEYEQLNCLRKVPDAIYKAYKENLELIYSLSTPVRGDIGIIFTDTEGIVWARSITGKLEKQDNWKSPKVDYELRK